MYFYEDEEESTKHFKKKIKKNIKSKHKHLYENCIVDTGFEQYFLSRCSVCGKIGKFKIDEDFKKNFPNRIYSFILSIFLSPEEKKEIYKYLLKKNVKTYFSPSFDFFKDKYI